MIELLALAFVALAFIVRRGLSAKGPLLAVLGSGGHTGELLAVLGRLRPEPVLLVHGWEDTLSVQRARQLGWPRVEFVALPRARKVHQSFASSVFSSLRTALFALKVLFRQRPHMIVCNGPGTCLVVVVVARLLLLNTRVIYIESFARVQTLSLTGKLMYGLKLADRFLVQWPELAETYPAAEFTGPLV